MQKNRKIFNMLEENDNSKDKSKRFIIHAIRILKQEVKQGIQGGLSRNNFFFFSTVELPHFFNLRQIHLPGSSSKMKMCTFT